MEIETLDEKIEIPVRVETLNLNSIGNNPPVPEYDNEFLREIESIPDKMAFKIGDVASLVGLKQYVLRYWETEFDELKPKKSKNNQRIYTRRDVETVMLIKKLLHRDRFSIEGARGVLKQARGALRQERDMKALGDQHRDALEKAQALLDQIRSFRDQLQII